MSDELREAEIEDARAQGYAQGRADQWEMDKVRVTLMSDELRMMPEILVDAYGALVSMCLTDGTEGTKVQDLRVPPRVRGWRTSSGQTETRGGAKASGKKGGAGGPTVKSARIMALKTSIDRKLRKIAREIENRMAGGIAETPRKCTRCGKYGEDTWIWCPWDGAAMQSEDRNAAS